VVAWLEHTIKSEAIAARCSLPLMQLQQGSSSWGKVCCLQYIKLYKQEPGATGGHGV